jgi:hypothetical protein
MMRRDEIVAALENVRVALEKAKIHDVVHNLMRARKASDPA